MFIQKTKYGIPFLDYLEINRCRFTALTIKTAERVRIEDSILLLRKSESIS